MTKIVEPGFTVTQTKFAGSYCPFYGMSETINTDMTDGYKTIAGSSHSTTQICQAGVECIDGKELVSLISRLRAVCVVNVNLVILVI